LKSTCPLSLSDVVLAQLILEPGKLDGVSYSAVQSEVDNICAMSMEAVKSGRAVNLGHLPNQAIKDLGDHGGPLYNQGGLPQPFAHPWLFMHSWDGGPALQRSAVAVYMVNPTFGPDGDTAGCEIVELQPCRINNGNVLLIGDRILLDAPTGYELRAKYHCIAVPSPMRYVPGMGEINNGMTPEEAAAGNVLDPLMAALLLLNAEGVGRVTVGPSEKLARARIKNRKPPLPSHIEVNSAPYVTAILARRAGRKAAQGGHHASPIPHIRRGHVRVYASGTRTIIRETLVNVTDEARATFVSKRSHYEVRT
jgi:hypothetical protein